MATYDSLIAEQVQTIAVGRAQSVLWPRLAVGATIALFLGLGLGYSLVVPPFETPDEIHHYAFARRLAQGHGLPIQTIEADGPWAHEGTQPPLYYFLVGRLTAGIDQSDFDQISQLNPHANMGNPLFPGNKNRMLYSARPLSLQGANLALHVGRWFSLLLGAVTLFLTYHIARRAFPRSEALPVLTVLLVASIPQFAFISAAVSNDSMITTMSTAVVYWLARLLVRDKERPIRWWEWGVLGTLVGLAALSKLQGLGLLILSAIAVLGMAWLRRDPWLPWRVLLPISIPVVVIAGWWYWRNYTLYGEWLAVGRLLTIGGLRVEPQTWAGLWGELRGLRYSFWGLFGWFSILMPVRIYQVLDGITLVAGAGALLSLGRLWRRHGMALWEEPANRVRLLLAIWAVMLVSLFLYWATFAISSQGRLFFPAISALATWLVLGLDFWLARLPARLRWFALTLLPVGLLACSVYALTILLPASYRAPRPVSAIPASARPVNLVYGNQIELLAIEVPARRFQQGEAVPITLYLRALKALESDYVLFVQLLDHKLRVIGNVTTHPGWGRNPTSLWHPGAIYPDHYQVMIESHVSDRSPLLAQVYVGFVDPRTQTVLPVRTLEGEPASHTVGFIEVLAPRALNVSSLDLRPADVVFGNIIRLIGYGFPSSIELAWQHWLTVMLLWEANGTPDTDYTAFVHLLNGDGQQVAGTDEPPDEGRFPTHRWRIGDRVLSEFRLTLTPKLSPGVYYIRVGLYESGTPGVPRLPVTEADLPVRDDTVFLGTIELR
jgi:4-amino-4-deoxy-L-arabinose transferase-like glycosyltransferase